MLRTLLLALACLPALAQEPAFILERREIAAPSALPAASLKLRLSLALLEDAGWEAERVLDAVREAIAVLAQCDIALEGAELVRIRAPVRYHDFLTPLSRRLAAAVPLARPAIWFVRDTGQRPAFDAEAIGRSNSRTRPELADTVWVTRGTRDLGIAIAHELAHVLMDSGEHSDEPDNLMREETAPGSTQLSPAQCRRMQDTARENGLLR
ncbi:MAG: hypothetical protein FJY51_06650 [Betaproteobacteria bacterium]|nr:hypothetical protein [Betaproteobacteria bacterium]